MPEIKRFGPIPVRGYFDEDGMYHAYERPHYDLFAEAVGSDNQVHMIQVSSGPELMDYPGLEDKNWELMEKMLATRMRKIGVWDA